MCPLVKILRSMALGIGFIVPHFLFLNINFLNIKFKAYVHLNILQHTKVIKDKLIYVLTNESQEESKIVLIVYVILPKFNHNCL